MNRNSQGWHHRRPTHTASRSDRLRHDHLCSAQADRGLELAELTELIDMRIRMGLRRAA